MQRAHLVRKRKIEYRIVVYQLAKKHSGVDCRFDTREEANKFMEQWKIAGYFLRLYKREFDVLSKEWTSDPIIIEEVYG